MSDPGYRKRCTKVVEEGVAGHYPSRTKPLAAILFVHIREWYILINEREKVIKAKEVLLKIANGTNPVDGTPINEESFLNDPRIIRCFFYISEVLNRVIAGQTNQNLPKPTEFHITKEEKGLVKFPENKIGANQFAKCINNVIDLNKSKKLSGVELNKQLKKMGVLSENIDEQGKVRTIINNKSVDYGFESEKRNYNGNEYEMVVINDIGKAYILENLEDIMKY